MTSELEDFARAHLQATEVVPVPRARGRVQVLRVVDDGGQVWYAKQLTRQARFDAERSGYRHWGHLPFVPALRAVDPAHRCLLVRGLPGEPPPWDSRRVLRAAGARLREMHDTAPGPEWSADWRTLARREVTYHLEALRARSVRTPVGRVRRALRELVALERLPVTVTHGDYQPYNWRSSSRSRHSLYVFDFGQAAVRPAVHDLTRLRYSVCWERPRLLETFVAGYGRPLSEDERRYLEVSLVIRAAIGLNLGDIRGRPVMVEHARRVLRQSR